VLSLENNALKAQCHTIYAYFNNIYTKLVFLVAVISLIVAEMQNYSTVLKIFKVFARGTFYCRTLCMLSSFAN